MGKAASTIQAYLCNNLSERFSTVTWQTEQQIAGTPVDIVGVDETPAVLVELEWRRADPADNTAKLFRHLSTSHVPSQPVSVVQVFTAYYDLAGGGISSKRKNAEFVGEIAANTIENLSYYPIDFDLVPPKRGDDLPDDWKRVADRTIGQISDQLSANI